MTAPAVIRLPELPSRLSGLLGLSLRAGAAKMGEGACLKAIRSGECTALLVDAAISQGSLKKLTDACAARGVRTVYALPDGSIWAATGRSHMTMALVPGSLSDRLLEALGQLSGEQSPPTNDADPGGSC